MMLAILAQSTGPVLLIIVVAAIVVAVLWAVAAYNGLIRMRNQVRNAWSQIDVQLRRRWDLIPNLVQTVKGYTKHERETLEKVTEARTQAQQAAGQGVAKQAEAESGLSGALSRLMVVVESYPDLKANQNYLALQEELTSTENKIGFARQFYNDQVMKFNSMIEVFPRNIIANMFNFDRADFFELEETAAREAPKVEF